MTVRPLAGSAVARASALAAAVLAAAVAAAWPSPAGADGAPQVKIDARDRAVVVECDAAAATILVGDRPRGVVTPGTSLVISLPEGTHQIAIEVAGYQRHEHTIAIQRGKTASLRATLAALTPPPAGGIELTSPYGSLVGGIELMSPYGSLVDGIELTSPYELPASRIELISPYGSPPGGIELRSPYESPHP